MGGGRGARLGLGRSFARGPRHGSVPPDDHRRVAGTGPTDPATCGAGGAGATAGRRSATADGDRPGVAAGSGVVGGTGDAWRSRVSAPLDLQEHPASG